MLLLLGAFAGAGCGGSGETETVDVQIGQSGQALGVTIHFVRVVSDTRCPEEAVCTIAGEVAVQLELRAAAESMTTELRTVRDRREATISGRRVTLVDVLPHPRTGRPTDPASYVARLTVEH